MPYPRRGGGGGAGFTLGPEQNVFTGATLTAAESARDTYFTASPTNLAIYNADTSLNIRLEYTESTVPTVSYQVRNSDGDAWLVNQSFEGVQGEPGQDGSGTDFSGISTNHIPAIGSDDRPFDSGLLVDANGDIVTPGSLQTGPGSVRIGPGFSLSNGVQTMALSKSTGQKALGVVVDYDETGSTTPFYYELAAQTTLDVNLLEDLTLPDPYTLNYTTFGNNLTTDFIFRPATAGDVRVRYWLGSDESGMLIFDETRTVTQGEVDSGADITFGIGNPYLLGAGTSVYVRSDGIQLKGTLISDPASPFDGQNLLYFRSLVQPYTEIEFMSIGNAMSSDVTTTAADSPILAPLAENQQLVNQAVDRAVSTLQNTIFNSGRSFVRFNDGFTIDDTNLAAFEDKNIIYTAKNDKPLDGETRPDVNLPTDADIAAAGESYPVTFEFTHLGGTVRSTTTNLVRFFFEGEVIGQILRDDAAVIVKTGVGVDYEVSAGTFSPGDTILPTGVFNLKVDTPISNISTIATELSGVSIVAGDAFLVETGGSWSGLTIPDNSILVAVVNGPSLLDSAANNDWLLLDNPRVNAKSAALLANFIQDGIRFDSTRNVQVDPSNVFEFSAMATGTPQTREIGTNTQGSGRSITYANVPIQFADLVGGRLMINLNFNVETVTGFSPSFTSVRLQYPGGIEFTFPVSGTTNNGNYTAAIDIPNVDYTSALNQDCTLTLFYDFFGQSFFGDYTVLGVINTSKGRLHDAISSLIITESVPLETRLQTQIDAITGELGEDEASFAAIQDRISPYRNNVSLSPDVNVRYLDSTGSDNFPSVSAMTAVNPLNTEYTMGTTAVFIAVATGVEQAVMNGGTQTLLTSANAQTDPNLELGESETLEGRTYFVYRLSNQAANDVIQTFDLTFVQVVAWQDDIDTLGSDVDRIDAELEHAALNLSDSLIDVLDNNVTVTEESNPTIVATEYNKSFSTNDTQAVFYEASPNAPSGGSHDSEAISVSSSKLVVIPEDHVFSDGVILQANDGSTAIDLVNFVGGQLVANVFVPAVPSGSKTVTVHPLPETQAQRDWYSLPLHTSDLRSEADEIFFTRNVPVAPTTLAFQYRYDANGGHGATQTINLVIADIAVDASVSASLSLPDGESVNVGFDWQAAQRRIRVTGTPFASDPNFFIFDMEVGVTFTETRTTPATPETTRPVVIGLSRATGQDAVIATKVSAGGDLILVGDIAEVDTNYAMTTLFGSGLVGNLTVFTELGTYLNYTQFTPSAQTVVSLENNATLPQFGLFTTEYTHDTIVTFDTQLQAHNSQGDIVNLGEELVLIDSGGDRWRLSVDANGNLSTAKVT